MYKIMTLDLKKLLLSRKQNYECVRRLFVFPKRAECRTFKQEVAVHIHNFVFVIKVIFLRSKVIILYMFTQNIPLLNNRRCYSN